MTHRQASLWPLLCSKRRDSLTFATLQLSRVASRGSLLLRGVLLQLERCLARASLQGDKLVSLRDRWCLLL